MNNVKQLVAAASFAAKQHSGQTRKGEGLEPYINHPLEVANLIANIGGIEDIDVLIAAILHDTVEDTNTTREQLAAMFGEEVAGIVLEVTDDKSLPKQRRKELQIEHSPHLSEKAKLVKLADKISNIRDVSDDPPSDWDINRRREYIDWGSKVIAGMRGTNAALERTFDELVREAGEKLS